MIPCCQSDPGASMEPPGEAGGGEPEATLDRSSDRHGLSNSVPSSIGSAQTVRAKPATRRRIRPTDSYRGWRTGTWRLCRCCGKA